MKPHSIGTNAKSLSAARGHSALQLIFEATMAEIVSIALQSIRQKSTTVSTTTTAGHMAMILEIHILLRLATTANQVTLQLLMDATTKEAVCSIKKNPSGHPILEDVGKIILQL